MKRVLFVDDEPNILQGLRRMLRGLRNEWTMEFAAGGAEALVAFKKEPFDIVVSDMKMPGVDGAQLLNEIRELNPETIRIILSGQSDKEAIMRSVGTSHRFLAKPCEPDVVKRILERSYALRELLSGDRLKTLVGSIESLPSLPSLYQEIMVELQKPNSSLMAVGQVIERDVGMSAKILKLVNSAYFGLLRPANNVPRAVSFLGLETINALVLSANIFDEYEEVDLKQFSIDALWDHSLKSGSLVRAIAATESCDKEVVNEAFTAAMLHDVGKLVLVANETEKYREVLQLVSRDGMTVSAAERSVFDATHAEVGAYLIGLWGLPDPIVEAICHHADPVPCTDDGFSPLTLVHVASALVREDSTGGRISGAGGISMEYLEALSLEQRLGPWREACHAAIHAAVDA